MAEAEALLALPDDEFAKCITRDSSVSEWIFREIKNLLQESEEYDLFSSKEADVLLLVVVRIVKMDETAVNLAQLVDRGVLSLSRVVATCSLYAQSNEHVMQWWIQRLCDRAPILNDQIPMLHDVFYHALLTIHHQVATLKQPCIIEATQLQAQICDIFKTIDSLLACSDSFLSILTPPQGDEMGHSFDGQTLLRAILVAYENDLPTLSNLSRNDKIISKTRRLIINSIYRWIDCLFLSVIRHRPSEADERCESFFGVLNSLLHNTDAVEPASLLSDLCRLLQFKSKCRCAFEESTIDSARVDYLSLLLSELPERARPKTTAVIDDTNPNVVVGDSPQDSKIAIVNSIVSQVKEIFPDLGDGFLDLCIQACEYSSDKVIMALLEDALPGQVQSLDRSMTKTDPRYLALVDDKEAKVAPPPQPQKVDPTQMWVGKKKQADKYKPESIKADPEYVAKQQMLAQTYDQEPAWPLVSAVDEYNDDYNDEMEEYEPFGVHDDEPTGYEEIIARNKAVRAQEAEDAFWESMRNPNHKPDIDEDEDGKDEGEGTSSVGAPASESSSANGRAGRSNGRQSQPRRHPPPNPNDPDPKKQAINRARKEKHKSSEANHRRKDKAMKKQGGGMF
ncbi:unnamed protein product [Aphanomyces euteiches]